MSNTRAYSYEVQACREGRWTIEGILPEEEPALALARARLASGAVEEAKVVRSRTMLGGFTTSKEILHEVRPVVKDPPLVVTGRPDGAPPCRELGDLYGLESRRVMGRMLRMFLDKFQATPTELLHNWTFARKFADTGTLMNTATFQVAKWQAEASGMPAKERIRELQVLTDAAMRRLRDLQAERRRLRLPAFEPGNLDYLLRRVEAQVAEGEGGFVFQFLLCQHLMASGSIGGKMEACLDLMKSDPDPRVSALLENVVADALGTADMVKDLLGPHPTLGASLAALAGFLNGRGLPGGGTPTLGRIGALMAEGRAHQCRAVLEDRLLSELARENNPLDRTNPGNDPQLLDLMAEALRTPEGGLLGGQRAEVALSRRKLRQRQEHLRRLGLHDQADALGAEFRKLTI